MREAFGAISRARALQSFSPSETATFILSLKRPLMAKIGKACQDPASLEREIWAMTELVDKLALHTTDVFEKNREKVILRQQQGLAELSTPVTDVGLPGMNGRQVAEIGRALRPDLRVLFMTGYAEAAVVRGEFLGQGMELIAKPFDLPRLGRQIRSLIDLKSVRPETDAGGG